mmetsp:Transcript_9301/g.39472  ORF Transcript_9301/g.39472 Transcript_9301/m.39472 type:complete len:269 (-) Transcript_9301:1416-2222(-)
MEVIWKSFRPPKVSSRRPREPTRRRDSRRRRRLTSSSPPRRAIKNRKPTRNTRARRRCSRRARSPNPRTGSGSLSCWQRPSSERGGRGEEPGEDEERSTRQQAKRATDGESPSVDYNCTLRCILPYFSSRGRLLAFFRVERDGQLRRSATDVDTRPVSDGSERDAVHASHSFVRRALESETLDIFFPNRQRVCSVRVRVAPVRAVRRDDQQNPSAVVQQNLSRASDHLAAHEGVGEVRKHERHHDNRRAIRRIRRQKRRRRCFFCRHF